MRVYTYRNLEKEEGSMIRVFIVEDSEMLRKRFIRFLDDLTGFEVAGEAEGAEEAIQGIRDSKPDLVILDIMLKRGSGIDVLREIRTVPRLPAVFVFTNYPFSFYKKTCRGEGTLFFFDKATEMDRMLAKLAEFRDKRLPPCPGEGKTSPQES